MVYDTGTGFSWRLLPHDCMRICMAWIRCGLICFLVVTCERSLLHIYFLAAMETFVIAVYSLKRG